LEELRREILESECFGMLAILLDLVAALLIRFLRNHQLPLRYMQLSGSRKMSGLVANSGRFHK